MGDGGGNRTVSVVEGHDNLGAETNNAAADDFVECAGARPIKAWPSIDFFLEIKLPDHVPTC